MGIPQTLSTLGIDLMQFECPHCQEVTNIKIRGVHPHMTGCPSCQKDLVVSPVVTSGPNAVHIHLHVRRVEALKEAV